MELIAGDIGGTKSWLAWVAGEAGGAPRLRFEKVYASADFASADALLRQFVAEAQPAAPAEAKPAAPVEAKPAAEKPAEKPAAAKPAPDKPASEKPAAEKPATQKPAPEKD